MLEFRHAALLKVALGETSTEEIFRAVPTEHLVADDGIAAGEAAAELPKASKKAPAKKKKRQPGEPDCLKDHAKDSSLEALTAAIAYRNHDHVVISGRTARKRRD